MKTTHTTGLEIAVVGMALRLPQAMSPDEMFDRLCRGEELIRPLDDALLREHGVSEADIQNPAYVKATGYLDGRFEFDAEFFDYKAREAEFMDPQLRLLHECCWEALESAGCDPQLHDAAVGLYAGSSQNMHWLRAVSQHVGDRVGDIYDLKMLYQREFFATRVAYRLNLKGPALAVDTTCSTSLVAIHLAAQGLLSGDCDVALAGGVCVSPLLKGYTYHEGMIQSPDGHCRPFDADAKGTVPGQGVGVVALKRLDDAIADGNPILAVLKSSAINNDGCDKVGYTAPSVSGQCRVIRAALALAEVKPEEIDFVECHGTATRIGDPIEVEALSQAYGKEPGAEPCLIGSVKSNVGHLDAAAGVIGFIKTVLAVKHGKLPPSLHYRAANPMMDLAHGRFRVNDALTPLVRPNRPLRAGVSSFGIGGTNVHAIVEEYLEHRSSEADSGRARLIPLSAKTEDALRRYASKLGQAVAVQRPALDALAKTLQQARHHYPVREYLVAQSHEQLLAQLAALADQPVGKPGKARDVVFMFSGQGAQYPGMTRDIYQGVAQYRTQVEACFALLPQALASLLRTLLLADASPDNDALIARTDLAQPLLFIVEYALASTLMQWGIQPTTMLGHSLGEYVAACLAGVFTLPDALALVCERGRLMAAAETGAMLSVRLSEAAIASYLDDGLELAAVNSSSLVVVAGTLERVAGMERRLMREGISCSRLKTSHAYHCHMMDGVLTEFRARVEATPRHVPQRSYLSNLTGLPITAAQACDPDYWCRHLRHGVRFADAVGTLLAKGQHAFVEIGPGNTLASFVRSHAQFDPMQLCLGSVRHPRETEADDAVLLRTVGRLYTDGHALDWQRLSAGIEAPYISLPTYGFAAQRFDQVAGAARVAAEATTVATLPAVRQEILHPRPQLSTPMVVPASEMEQRLCAVWQALFKLDRVGTADNFFELGGHSLLATRLLADIRDAFDAELSLNDLFEQPTVAGLASLVAQAGEHGARYPALQAADRTLPIPVSFQQRRLWMIDRLGGGSAQYSMPSPFILHGKLDHAVLQAALDMLVLRHESLRTVFHEVEGEPMQVILPAAPLPILKVDLQGLDAAERTQRQRDLVREDALRPFDLAHDHPLRVTLAVLDEREHLLLFNIHHIVSDGWSEALMVKEFREIYSALATAREPVLPALPMQYADFAAWQRNWLVGETLEAELGFWRQRLAGMPPVHNLPLDRPRPLVPSHAGAMSRRKLSPQLLRQLRNFGQEQGATLFMTLQAAFALLLARWSNSEDIVMGTPIAGRLHKQLEPLIGFFVNTLLLRSDLSGDPDFRQLLQRTKEMALSAFEHQHVPFEMLVEELAPARSRSHAPLFQVLFALQNFERGSFSLEGLELERVEETVTAKFDLTLITAEAPDGLFTDWYYDTALFDARTIERMADQFELLLSSILARPDQPVSRLPLLPEQERHVLLHDWQQHQPAPAQPQRIEAMFEACAARCPDAAAVVFEQELVSYAELEMRANQLAHLLIAQGVVADNLVAICLPPGADMVVAMLAALKCGAAYVPMDPKYPLGRLTHMLSNSNPSALVTTASVQPAIEVSCPVLDMASPELTRLLASQPQTPPQRELQRVDGPAYVIYTSGSTGAPKGVVITQRQMMASLASRFALYEAPTSALLLNSISFDSSIPTIFGTLLTGGCLCLCDDNQRRDAAAIAELIERWQVSHLLSLPSVYCAVLDFIDGAVISGRSLKVVILAAEMFTTAVKTRHFAHPTIRAKLYNEYGPTECSVWSTYYLCDPAVGEATVPIGRSPGHARLYVLNHALELAPIGVEGELYIGGDGVGAGYLHQPELTAQRFVPDPYAAQADARMYRSGDRVRWRADGELEILGRIDNQVKLRGYRIELSEIDTALERHPAVVRAVARVVDDRLVAYVSLAAGSDARLATSEARRFLADGLPDFMLPQLVVELEHLPLLPNGKVDLTRLPIPQPAAFETGQRRPANATEQQVHDAWCAVLKAESIPVDQDFFSLGGDSILLLKLSAHLNRQGLRFSAKDFYAEPTIVAMARLVEVVVQAPVQQQPAQGEQALHPMQAWLLGGDATDLHHFNQSVMLELTADFSLAHAELALLALIDRHDVLRLRFDIDSHGHWRANYRTDTAALAAASLSTRTVTAQAQGLGLAIEQEAGLIQQSLALDGPLMRVVHLQLDDGTARLLIVVHHLVVDGISWRVLLQDFELAYRQAEAGAARVLPARPASFQQAVALLQQRAAATDVLAELPCWEAVLGHTPGDWGVPAVGLGTFADEASETLVLDQALTECLLTSSHLAYGMNIEETLMAALRHACHAWRGVKRLAVVMEGHGRGELGEVLDVGETVGWFTATYPWVFGDAAADLAELLRDTKEQLRGIPAKGEHYGVLKYLSGQGARLDDSGFKAGAISFNYLGQFDQVVNAGGLFRPAREKPGRNISADRRRDVLLALDGLVSGGQLRFSIKYNRHQFDSQAIGELVTLLQASIAAMADYWQRHPLRQLTPSDVGLLSLTQGELSQWQAQWPALSDVLPATGSQQGMLYQSLRDAGQRQGAFVNQLVFDLDGQLDMLRLQQAFACLPHRHDVFRAAFAPMQRGGMAMLLQAAEQVSLPFCSEDLAHLSLAEQEAIIAAEMAEDRRQGFDIGVAPLSRVTLWHLGAGRYRVLWTTHHAIIDGWSLPLVFRSLLDSYAQSGQLQPPGRQFKHYLQWLQHRDVGAAKDYWQRQLAAMDAPCLLPNDGGIEAVSLAGSQKHTLGSDQFARLDQLAKAKGVTLYSLAQCAWAYLLHLYTGRSQVCFGSVTAGRPHELAGADAMVGLFINTMPVVLAVDGATTLGDWLKTVHQSHLQRLEQGYLPLPDILAQSALGSRTALFNSALVYENYPVDSIREAVGNSSGLRLSGLRSEESTGTGLTLVLMPSQTLTLKLQYQTGEFSHTCAQQILVHFTSLLAAMPELVDGPVHGLDDAIHQPEEPAEISDAELLSLLSELDAVSEE
ncbi:amino acid adenylation domain-containing protein [Chitinimonas viridis]|uniref:Amino acid adenylation domain-containing protein n=1 Tax=Chitinimonas viridis TaxID=664880 RepID=A0ABT8B7U1_9NEIS|nr:non-ribosomal peptide synthetase/type I polyketide synthase [Chitinimonas viridis]MDN3578327.1 amino acid adenylation domain-containing protein [Chitinimonas viridis]